MSSSLITLMHMYIVHVYNQAANHSHYCNNYNICWCWFVFSKKKHFSRAHTKLPIRRSASKLFLSWLLKNCFSFCTQLSSAIKLRNDENNSHCTTTSDTRNYNSIRISCQCIYIWIPVRSGIYAKSECEKQCSNWYFIILNFAAWMPNRATN